MKKSRYTAPLLIAMVVVGLGLTARLTGIPFLDIVELKTIDLRFQLRGKVPPSPDLVLAVIDEKSLVREGKWVWPRSKIARLTRKLSGAGARVIAFDIGFLEPDRTDLDVMGLIQRIRNHVQDLGPAFDALTPFLSELERSADNDRLLAEAIRDADAEAVLGYFFGMGGGNGLETASAGDRIDDSRYGIERYTSLAARNTPLIAAAAPHPNIPMIAEAAFWSGYFNIFPDADGAVRRAAAVIRYDDALYAPLALKAVSAFLDAPLAVRVAEYGVDAVFIGDRMIPVDELGQMVVNFRGPERTFPHISATDILNDRVNPAVIRDKIVLVGATAAGIYDLRVTPFGTVFPGLEIHANIADNALAGDPLRQPAWLIVPDILAMLLFGLVLGVVLPRLEAVGGLILALFLLSGYLALGQYLFVHAGIVVNLVYPATVLLLAYAGITVYRYLTASRQKKFIRDAFSTYLSPSVVRQLIDHPDRLVLGGEERVITAFFSDVEGFTGISERLAPQDLVELLNEFLTEMTDIILRHEGTVDKFEGDAIIAMFGAPHPLDHQARSACIAAIEMQQRLAALRKRWADMNRPIMRMRIGLHTGPAVVGNMGSENRMDYTMMGDTVNTAARIETVNKLYRTYALIGERTRREAGEDVICREVDYIRLLGRIEPVALHELIGRRPDATDDVMQAVAVYARGLDAYRGRDWAAAASFFQRTLRLNPDDGPAQTLLARCDRYKTAPPPDNWDGAFAMTSK